LAEIIRLDPLDVCYAFDSVLKYPLFGEFAGDQGNYLNHPLKDAFPLPTMRKEKGTLPVVAVSFRDSIAKISNRLSKDQYTSLLHELRSSVRDAGLDEMSQGQFNRAEIRDIAARVALPPRLRGLDKVAGIAGGIISGLGIISELSPVTSVLGGAIFVAAALWRGHMPRGISRIKWLRWALKWNIEDQADQRDKRANTYEVSSCQETNDPYEQLFLFCRLPGLVQSTVSRVC
jgi:hypothetical protein